jgi:hypothetical protein
MRSTTAWPRAAGTRPAINATATPSPPSISACAPTTAASLPATDCFSTLGSSDRTSNATGDVVRAVTLPPSSSVPRTGARDRSRSLRLRPCHHACRRVQHWSPPSRGYVGITHSPKRSGHSLGFAGQPLSVSYRARVWHHAGPSSTAPRISCCFTHAPASRLITNLRAGLSFQTTSCAFSIASNSISKNSVPHSSCG